MKKKYRLEMMPFVFVGLVLTSCGTSKLNSEANAIDNIFFVQDGTTQTIKEDIVELKAKRKPFEIHFYNKAFHDGEDGYNLTRIAAVPTQEELDKIAVGVDAEKTVNLETYSALAVSKENGYNKELFINDYGHHILYHSDEEEHTVDTIGKKGDYLLMQFSVASIFEEPNFIPIEETDIKTIYFAIYSDFNRNKIIDNGELTKVILTFE